MRPHPDNIDRDSKIEIPACSIPSLYASFSNEKSSVCAFAACLLLTQINLCLS